MERHERKLSYYYQSYMTRIDRHRYSVYYLVKNQRKLSQQLFLPYDYASQGNYSCIITVFFIMLVCSLVCLRVCVHVYVCLHISVETRMFNC